MTTPTDPADPTDPTDPAAASATDAATDPADPAAPDATDWKAEAEKWKRQSRTNEDRAKANSAAAKKLAEIEEAQKTDTQKLTDRLAAAEDRASVATKLAAAARIEAMAAGRFADPQDAVDALGGQDFLDSAGQVDRTAIGAALDDLLQRKPHWAAAAGNAPRTPAPDPAQGARPGAVPTLAQQIREAEDAGDIKKAISLKSRQLREIQTPRK